MYIELQHVALQILEANGKQHGMGVVTTSKAGANQHGSFGPIGMWERVCLYHFFFGLHMIHFEFWRRAHPCVPLVILSMRVQTAGNWAKKLLEGWQARTPSSVWSNFHE